MRSPIYMYFHILPFLQYIHFSHSNGHLPIQNHIHFFFFSFSFPFAFPFPFVFFFSAAFFFAAALFFAAVFLFSCLQSESMPSEQQTPEGVLKNSETKKNLCKSLEPSSSYQQPSWVGKRNCYWWALLYSLGVWGVAVMECISCSSVSHLILLTIYVSPIYGKSQSPNLTCCAPTELTSPFSCQSWM